MQRVYMEKMLVANSVGKILIDDNVIVDWFICLAVHVQKIRPTQVFSIIS